MVPAVAASVPGTVAERQDDTGSDLGRKQKWFRAYETNKSDEMKEAREARQYYHDKQWTEAEKNSRV